MLGRQIELAEQGLISLDDRVHGVFEPYTGSAPIRGLDLVSKLGDQPQLRLIAGGLMMAGTLTGNARLVRAGARMMIAHEAATLAKGLIKADIDRTRPRSAEGREDKKPKKGRRTSKEETSFPSGHTAGSIAAARAFSREFPEYGAAAMGAAGLVAAAQVARCAHYPTDVVAGAAIGLAAEAVTGAAWNAARMDERSTE
jgi:membrane-associated phospholipid phosphatase